MPLLPAIRRTARVLATVPAPSIACRASAHIPRWHRQFHASSKARGVGGDKPKASPRLPEFSLHDKVVIVSGGARGLGLVQAEALLEAGAKGETATWRH